MSLRLDVIRPFDPWRSPLCTCPTKWVIHPYTGCPHRCLYCYASSYIPRHSFVRAKQNFLDRLRRDLAKLPKSALIEMSSSSDPYPPIEVRYGLTREALHELLSRGFYVLVVTKGTLITRDLDVVTKYRDRVVVSITVTTLRDSLASLLEPGAPPSSERLSAIKALTSRGVKVVARVDPIIPYINDDYEELKQLIRELSALGVKHVTSSTYKAKPDSLRRIVSVFPDVGKKLLDLYGKDLAEYVHGYRYLRKDLRLNYMKTVKELVEAEGLTFGVCREGFPSLITPGFTCDGSSYLYID